MASSDITHLRQVSQGPVFPAVLLFFAAGIVGFVLALPTPSQAHNSGVFYASFWVNDHTENWFMRDNVPGPAFSDRVKDAFPKWNDTPNDGNAEPNFDYSGVKSDSNGNAWDACEASYSAAYYKDLDVISTGLLGFGDTCDVNSGGPPPAQWFKITKFTLTVDSTRNWQVGTGSPGPNEFDLLSLTAHEVGHVTGWSGHFDGDSQLCQGSDRPTMCQGQPPGTSYMRSLEAHDTHTFEDAYPHPYS